MTFVRTHPFATLAALAGAAVLLATGIRTIGAQPAQDTSQTISFIVGGGLQNPDVSSDSSQASSTIGAPDNSFAFTPGAAASIPQPVQQEESRANQLLSQGPTIVSATPNTSAGTGSAMSNSLLSQVYGFVPGPVIVSASASPKRTPEQQALYDYGNEAGLAILTFENAHTDMAEVLDTWFKGRSSGKNGPALQLAHDLSYMGSSIGNLPHVPKEAQSANQALASSAQTAGEKLAAVINAGSGSDAAILAAMETYNSAADTYTKSVLALTDLFSLRGVTFNSSDPGSVFQFNR